MQQDETACYYKSSPCDACYSLCSNQNITDLPYFVKQCLITDTHIDLKLNSVDFKNDISIKFLLKYVQEEDSTNNCQLNNIRIVQSDEFLDDKFNISIRSVYLLNNQISQSINNNSQAQILNAQFYFQNLNYVEISSIYFTGNQIQQNPALYFEKVLNSTVKNSTFSNITIEQNNGASISLKQFTFMAIYNTLFHKNQLLYEYDVTEPMGGTAIYLTDNSKLQCYNCSFLNNDADCSYNGGVGGAIYLSDFSVIDICWNCEFIGNIARSGGAIYLTENSIFSNCLNCLFESNLGYDSGGAVSVIKQSIMTLIVNTNFINNQQLREDIQIRFYGGGAVYIQKNSAFQNSSGCFFNKNSANSQGGAIFMREYSTYSSSPNCFFLGNKAYMNGGAIFIYLNSYYNNSPNCTFTENICGQGGGAINLQTYSIYSNSSNCTFLNNQANNSGGSLFMELYCVYSHSPNCIFKQNFAEGRGGAIFITRNSAYTYSENVIFCANHANENGGAVYIYFFSNYSYSSNCTFFRNNAEIYGGAIDICNNSRYFNSSNCSFYNNSAKFGGAIIIELYSMYLQSSSCQFDNNIAYRHGGAILFIHRSIYDGSQNCSFKNNNAGSNGGALSFYLLSVYTNSSFCNFINNQASSAGGAIFLHNSSYSDSQNIIFQNNMALEGSGGALKIEQFSNYTNAPNCIFIQNIAFDSGGAISLYNHSQYLLSPNTTFIQNYAFKYGGGIAIEQSDNSKFNFQQIYFENNSAHSGGAFYSDFSANINIQQSSFINNTAQSGNGGAVYFDQILQTNYNSVQTNMSNNLFIRNTAIFGQGGSIFTKSHIYQQNVTIESSEFKQNLAIIGGAISLEYVLIPSFINNSFSFNKATQQGGAFYCQSSGFIFNFIDYDGGVEIQPYDQMLSQQLKYEIKIPFLIKNNEFYENQAKEVAGAIYLDFTQSKQSIVNDFYLQQINITSKQNISIIMMKFCFVKNKFKNNLANYGGAAIRVNGFSTSMILDNSLNSSCAQTQIMIQENNNTFENNTSPLYKQFTPQNFLQYQKINQTEILCSCMYGEKLAQNPTNEAYFCQKCEENTYLKQYHDNLAANQPCVQCPQGFNCPGGYENLKVQQNYWSPTNLSIRGNDQSFEAYRCDLDYQIKHACVGYEKCKEGSTQCSDDLLCQINFMGPACQICNEKQKYYAAGQNSCQKCGSNTLITLKLVGTVIIILLLLLVSISSTIRKIHKQMIIKSLRIGFDQIIVDKDQLTALMRIITNYFQNTSYFFLLQIQVPDYVEEFFLFTKNFGQPLQSFSSTFQCLLDSYEIEGITKKLQYLLYQFVWSLALPTAVVILLYFVKYLKLILTKKNISHPIQLLIAPTYIYLYLEFLPTLFYNSLSFLTCRKIAGRKYVIGDSQYECNQSQNGVYSFQNLSVALPIFLFQLFIPILVVSILVMFKHKNLLNKPVDISSCKYQLGYFYLGYKQSCYYWEFLRIFQRLLITSSFLVLYDYNSQKAALVILILISYSLLANYLRPNENIIVQNAEFYSNYIQIYTFISALMLQQFTYSWLYYFFLIAVTVINIIFIIYILNLMLINVKVILITLLMKYKYFTRFKFVRTIIEKNTQRKNIVKKWITLKIKIREIIALGCNSMNQILVEKEQPLNSNFNQREKQINFIDIESRQGYQLLCEEDQQQIKNSKQTIFDHVSVGQTFYQTQKEFNETAIN